jgi:hypothetical protein
VIRPYEVNGVSLTRINKTHTLPTDSELVSANKNMDKYYLKVDRNGRSTGDNQLSFRT